jgi:hypothetical protein
LEYLSLALLKRGEKALSRALKLQEAFHLRHGAKFDIRTGEVLQDPAYEAVARHKVRITGADIEVEI